MKLRERRNTARAGAGGGSTNSRSTNSRSRRVTTRKNPRKGASNFKIINNITSQPVWWLINALGTDTVMEAIIKYYNKNLKYNIEYTSPGESAPKLDTKMLSGKTEGIAFYGISSGHWKAFVKETKDGDLVKKDPYDVGVQQRGTHGFCQTFALMLLLKQKLILKDEEKNNDKRYDENTKLALQFILKAVVKSTKVANAIIATVSDITHKNRRDKEYYDVIDEYVIGISLNDKPDKPDKPVCLNNMTRQILIKYLEAMIVHYKTIAYLLRVTMTRTVKNKYDKNKDWYTTNGECE